MRLEIVKNSDIEDYAGFARSVSTRLQAEKPSIADIEVMLALAVDYKAMAVDECFIKACDAFIHMLTNMVFYTRLKAELDARHIA